MMLFSEAKTRFPLKSLIFRQKSGLLAGSRRGGCKQYLRICAAAASALSSQLFSNHNKQLLKNPETAGELIIIKNETTVRRRAGARGPIWE
jgi:hypothetical protein